MQLVIKDFPFIKTTGLDGSFEASLIASSVKSDVVINIPLYPNGIVPFNSRIDLTLILFFATYLLACI